MYMYKKDMTDVPAKIWAEVSKKLEKEHRKLTHIAFYSMLEATSRPDMGFILIARDEEPKDEKCYAVMVYDADDGDFFREKYELTYADALIQMGEIIKE